MLRRVFVGEALAILLMFCLVPRAGAWNETGHKAVALIACFELKDEKKAAMAKLLKSHPHAKIQTADGLAVAKKHFTGDNFFTAGRPSGVDEEDWVILRAATWPDFVRPPKVPRMKNEAIAAHEIFKFHRSNQHFTNIPFVLPGFTGDVPENEGTILQTLEKAEKDLRDPTVSDSEKAIALCWLLHLIGDIHQPLHCTMLVSDQFPDGDRGGNSDLIGSTNLHSFWDELIGRSGIPFDHLNDITVTIHRSPLLQRRSLRELRSKEYKVWANESFELAKTVAYKDGHLLVGSADHRHDDGSHTIPGFPEDYKTSVLPVAKRRIALAGYRLADKLSSIF